MTHVLAIDSLISGIGFVLTIVFILIVGAVSSGRIGPYRRKTGGSFWHTNDPNNSIFGQAGLLDQLNETTNQFSSDSHNNLSIYQAHDNSSHSTYGGSSGSILGLNDRTEPSNVYNSDGPGTLGSSAAEYLNLDTSSGGFGDSGGYSSDNSFSDSGTSFSDTGTSFSDSGSSSFSSDN